MHGCAEALVCQSATGLRKDNSFVLISRLRSLGATNLKWAQADCAIDRFNESHDIHIISRGALLGMGNKVIVAFLEQLQRNKLGDFLILKQDDIDAELAARTALRSKIEAEVISSKRAGYGFVGLAAPSSPTICAAPTAYRSVHEHLITRHEDALHQFLLTRTSLATEFMPTDEAFIRARRKGCSFIYGHADDLKLIASALKRDKFDFSFVETWSTIEDFDQAKEDVSTKEAQKNRDEEAARQREENQRKLDQQRKETEGQAQREATERLRKNSQARVSGLTDTFDQELDAFLNNSGTAASTIRALYPNFNGWYASRVAEGWELNKRNLAILDFGQSDWNGRSLETIYLRLDLSLKNRLIGSYNQSCWIFSRVEDSEFQMQRAPFVINCDSAEGHLVMRQQRTSFRSNWNATK